MKVAILGHHPDLFPGFNALMTVNFAYGLSQAGLTVTVLLPETTSHPQTDRMVSLGLSEKTLACFDADVEYRVVRLGENLGRFDLGVWQSYFAEDEGFFPVFRKSVDILAKNFPRLFTGVRSRDEQALAGSASRFDVIGLSLMTDKAIADQMVDAFPDAVSKTIYMPRGFRSDWFTPASCTGSPVFGIEKGVQSDSSEYAYLIPVIDRLRAEFGQVDVIGARLKDPRITTTTLKLLPAKEFYAQFINPLWAYLMIDVNKSRQSVNAVRVSGKTVYPGLYENQVVEAHLAGASVVGHQDALPEELVASSRTALRFGDFNDSGAIFDFLASVINNRSKVAAEARDWAKKNHSISNMVRPLLEVI
ncbi:MAG: hypothetical protein GVY36_03405 [Verrucomicrobia bacterium]|jgi:hypothetical protein|nr:hypothetical protein [Verrucomicrobiota bacterium]